MIKNFTQSIILVVCENDVRKERFKEIKMNIVSLFIQHHQLYTELLKIQLN